MCLAVPGQVLELNIRDGGLPSARVKFGAVTREVCLAYTPEAVPGDYVIVHTGFALQILDQAAAQETLKLLEGSLADHCQNEPAPP